ncbi:MAG: YeeE/YedE family protein [Acidithiobacillus sp.]|nr:YeeE/YedE family protein [Acidithiobacillus sp.]
MKLLSTLLIGLLFGIGLNVSGMTDPARITGFFDIFGAWDPSLLFVMAGALGVSMVGIPLVIRRGKALLADKLGVPTRRDITPSLLIGSFLFGSGWGLAGYCPGPALASLGTLETEVVLFFVAMIIGMFAHSLFEKWQLRQCAKGKRATA